MKRILLIALISLTSIGFSQIKATGSPPIDSAIAQIKSEIPDSSQLTFKEVYTDIKSGLSALGESLKVGSEHVYKVLVMQQVVRASVWFILIGVGMMGMFYFYRCFKSSNRFKVENRWVRKPGYDQQIQEFYNNESQWSDSHTTKTVITGILSIALLIAGVVNIDVILTGFINPEYGAIKEILEVIK